jgi:hypothetical protein
VLAIVTLASRAALGQPIADEYRLKAAFIYKFAQFTEWPAPALAGRKTIELCVLEPNPFGRVLVELVEGETLAGRPLQVRRLDRGATLETCHVLFLPARAPERRDLLKRVAATPVLTVSDAANFLDEGGIVQLRVVADRTRFDISVAAAVKAQLRLSSQLLRLAMNVRGGPS